MLIWSAQRRFLVFRYVVRFRAPLPLSGDSLWWHNLALCSVFDCLVLFNRLGPTLGANLLYIPFDRDDISVLFRSWVRPGRVNLGPVTIKLWNVLVHLHYRKTRRLEEYYE